MSSLPDAWGAILIDVARMSILSTVHASGAAEPAPAAFPAPLQAPRATFVTLRTASELRGCCGTLEPRRALVLDVWHTARSAAREDRRFAPVTARELDSLALEVSVLTPLERIHPADEADLLAHLEACATGLYLKHGAHCATFLPKVWESLPEPRQFLRQLKLKAGLGERYWSPDIEWYTYQTDCFAAPFRTETTCH